MVLNREPRLPREREFKYADLRRLGSGERNSPEAKARSGPSELERVSQRVKEISPGLEVRAGRARSDYPKKNVLQKFFPLSSPNEERAGVRSSSFNYPFDALFIRRHEPLTGHIFHHPHAARPALQRIPNRQQAALAVLPPLAVPETQRFNVLIRQKFFAHGIALQSFRQTVLETVQFHSQPRRRAIEIQNIITLRMLPAKFETRKPMAAQCPPQIPFLVCLITAKLAGG